MRNQNIMLLVALAATLSGCGNKEKDFDATGTFEATEVTVSSESNGKLETFDVEEGTILKKGQEVALIDTVQLSLSRLQLIKSGASVRANSPAIETQIADLRERLDKQNKERRRVEALLADGAASQKQLDDINADIKMIVKQIAARQNSMENTVASINAQSSAIDIQVAQIDDKLRKCHVSSPIEGSVIASYAEAGELASVGKPLFKIADLNKMYLRAYLTSAQLADVKIGQKTRVMADYGGGVMHEYDGVVTWISSTSEFTPKTILTNDERADLVYAVKVAVKNDGKIKIGMYGKLVINP